MVADLKIVADRNWNSENSVNITMETQLLFHLQIITLLIFGGFHKTSYIFFSIVSEFPDILTVTL